MAHGRGADDERAVGDGISKSLVDFRRFQDFCRANGGARTLERHVVRMHEAETAEAKVADRARCGPNVQGVARIDEDNSDVSDFRGGEHRRYSTAGPGKWPQWMWILLGRNCNSADVAEK